MDKSIKWHGWIYMQKNEGYTDTFFVNYKKDGRTQSIMTGQGNEGASKAIEFFDTFAGEPVKLQPLGVLGYRVYTENPSE